MPLKVILFGGKGRMGQTLAQLASQCDAEILGAIDEGETLSDEIWAAAQVVIDFSFHTVTASLLEKASQHKVPVVIGTTGHTESEVEAIKQTAQNLALTLAGNYSIGVNLLFHLTREAARILPSSYAPEITEIHHRHKKDAPSGTAKNLAEMVEGERDLPDEARIYGRSGDTGARPQNELAVHALRGGEIVGEHTVFFFGDSDRIELTHRASDRGIFARGAFQAAHWLTGQEAGLYSMQDVLGLK